MNPESKYIILGNPERERILADTLHVWLDRLGPDADIPSIELVFEGVKLSPRLHVDLILRGDNDYGIDQIRAFEEFIEDNHDIGFDDLMQRLRGEDPQSTLQDTITTQL